MSPANNVATHRYAPYVRWGVVAVGVLMVLVGLADASARLARATFGDSAGQTLFAPAGAIGNPQILESVQGTQNSAAFAPMRIAIPAIGVEAAVEHVGVRADGAMETPKEFDEVAWYKDGARPGEPGNAVFAGHVNNALTQSGVFAHLARVSIGDYVTLADAEGRTLVYKVKAIDQYPADEAPAASIFAKSGASQVVLITCDGDWVPAEKTFDKRLVITATPAYR